MDALERLTLEDAAAPSLLALTHVHRYQVAAGLCDGMKVLDLCCGSGYGARILAGRAASVTGVDLHQPSIERARAALTDVDAVSFEVADALEWLKRDLAPDFDAIVLLEGLEHLPDAKVAVELLRGHAEAGMSLIISIPNEGEFPEDNEFHVTRFEYEDAIGICAGLKDAHVLGQSHAEGSLICALQTFEIGPLKAELALAERADAESFNHYLVLANLGVEALFGSSRMQLSVAPTFHRYMLDLERENRVLWRTNQRLARDKLGVADSAAAAALTRIDALEQIERPEEPRPAPAAALRRSRLKSLALIALNVMPHGLTLALLRHRQRVRSAKNRSVRLERAGLAGETDRTASR